MTTSPKPPGPMDAQRILDESKIRIACAETCGHAVIDGVGAWLGQKIIKEWDGPDNPYLIEDEEQRFDAFNAVRAIPNYLHDANAALLLVEKAKEMGHGFGVLHIDPWACYFASYESRYHGNADTFCAAVCEAWLRLCGKWEEASQ